MNNPVLVYSPSKVLYEPNKIQDVTNLKNTTQKFGKFKTSTLYSRLLFAFVSQLSISQANSMLCGKAFTGSIMGLPAHLLNKNY